MSSTVTRGPLRLSAGRRGLAILAFVVSALVSAAPARADEASAQRRFEEGTKAFAKRDYRVAATFFEAAYTEAPAGGALYNAALAWSAAGENERAANAFDGALAAGGLEPQAQERARARLAELRVTLARARVIAPPGAKVSMDGGFGLPAPATLYSTTAGSHVVVATLTDGRTLTRSVKLWIGEERKLGIFDTQPPESGLSPARLAGFIAGGGAVVFGAIAIGTGVAGLAARDDFDASRHLNRDARDSAISLRTATNVMWAFAAASAAAGAVLIFVIDRPKSDKPAKAAVLAGPGSLDLRVQF